jgi:hypothetical protein
VSFPLPGSAKSVVAVPAPGDRRLDWAGAPSAALDEDGGIVLGYRLRLTEDDVATTVVARSDDGHSFSTVCELEAGRFGGWSIERPAIVRTEDGRWRIYVCPATPNSKHWWIGMLEADDPAGFADVDVQTVFPGDDTVAVKDPVIRRDRDAWHAWICCHPLDEPDEEDRMTTVYATSADGVEWESRGTVLAPEPGRWDSRGTRLTAILPDGRAAYDGRATKDENWFERTGLANPDGGRLAPAGDAPVSTARYLDVLPLPAGGYRIYYEWPLPGESHELRTELVAR